MGRSHATALEKRMFVMDLGNKFGQICFAACEGLYESAFFDEFNTSTSTRRLRAVVQNSNIGFAASMLNAPLVLSFDSSKNAVPSLAERAKELVQSYRGKELPGTFNPNLIGQLFRELSRSWYDNAQEHINAAWIHARTTVIAILNEVAEQDVRDICLKKIVDPELEVMQQDMSRRLDDYMLEFRRQPITYNHYLTETVQTVKYEREYAKVRARCMTLFANGARPTSNDVDLVTSTIVKKHNDPDMDAIAAQELMDYAKAYYKVALKRVIDEVPSHIIEPAIMNHLPHIFDPTKTLEKSEDLIEAIGGESDARKTLREALQTKLDVFTRSSMICKIHSESTAQSQTSLSFMSPESSQQKEATESPHDEGAEDAPATPESAVEVAAADDNDGWGFGSSPFTKKTKKGKVAHAKGIFE